MKNQKFFNGVTEGLLDINLDALLKYDTADELGKTILRLYRTDDILPKLTNNIRRIFPHVLTHAHPSEFSDSARSAFSGMLFGLVLNESLPVDQKAAKYLVSTGIENVRNSDDFLQIGLQCLHDSNTTLEMIPHPTFVESENTELELCAGFGFIVSKSFDAFSYQYPTSISSE